MKILYIHQDRKLKTGAHYINDILMKGLKRAGVEVENVYPEEDLGYFHPLLKGIRNILFFFSLIERKKDIASYDIIQGTTYTPLAFLHSNIPVFSIFGSTSYGFLKAVPNSKALNKEHSELFKILSELKERGVLSCVGSFSQPVKDVSRIEFHTAKNSRRVVATSQGVKSELVKNGVPQEKVAVVWNGIENFWFKTKPKKRLKKTAGLVYLGRMGEDSFTVKLKGINRMIYILRSFPNLEKVIIGLTEKKDIYSQVFHAVPKTTFYPNLKRRAMPKILKKSYGDIFINPSRYEGFCLSLVEAMSQGLIPISFSVGVAPEIIKNGQNGFLVNSVRQMIFKINKLSQDKEKRAQMAKAAFETAKMFKAEIMVKKYIELYESELPPKAPCCEV
ncbi:MAG: glycosyltransferase family 4 protein [Candidatus Pacebacteria bacterium]|nr:glycosyltransferase family 4 protein [Candidatus Paceibacterota bacterium]